MDFGRYEAMLSKYSPLTTKHLSSVSGKLFHLLQMPMHPRSYMERVAIGHETALQLTGVSELNLRCRLGKSIELMCKERNTLTILHLTRSVQRMGVCRRSNMLMRME